MQANLFIRRIATVVSYNLLWIASLVVMFPFHSLPRHFILYLDMQANLLLCRINNLLWIASLVCFMILGYLISSCLRFSLLLSFSFKFLPKPNITVIKTRSGQMNVPQSFGYLPGLSYSLHNGIATASLKHLSIGTDHGDAGTIDVHQLRKDVNFGHGDNPIN